MARLDADEEDEQRGRCARDVEPPQPPRRMRTDVVEDENENGVPRQPDDRVATVPAPLRAARSMRRQGTLCCGPAMRLQAWPQRASPLSVAQTSNYQEMVISQRSGQENIRENERVQQEEANVHEAEEGVTLQAEEVGT